MAQSAAELRRPAPIERIRGLGILFGFAVVYGVFALLNHQFISFANLTAVALQSELFRSIFAGSLGPVPTPVILAIVCALGIDFVLRRTTVGEHIIAIGGNEETARPCGVAKQMSSANRP